MASHDQTGRAPLLSMADFNARAKRIAAATGAVEKGETHRPRSSRFRRDVNGGISSLPKKDEMPG